ncbi:hypothetical protein AVEN_37438-1 [Araneus ventricosus]|uniref:Uncharacterized protein n=1 Tax=Araneus ventricosus TaxID=182803 RepID=A0A4Y2FDS9_ARAVE|nr:hypothetical protein AVEN_37438-1 [Araneus ventricosus]
MLQVRPSRFLGSRSQNKDFTFRGHRELEKKRITSFSRAHTIIHDSSRKFTHQVKSILYETITILSEQSRRSYCAWLGKSLRSARVNGCTDTIWPLPLPLMCLLFTAIRREIADPLTSP